MPIAGSMRRFRKWLARPVDGASLAVFRMGFGLSMAYMTGNFLRQSSSGVSPIDLYFRSDRFHFSYAYLDWIKPFPEPWTTVLFAISALSSLLVAAGLFYRLAAAVQFATFNYYWLMEATFHGNHFVLAAVFVVLLPFVPANAAFSLDAWLFGGKSRAAPTVPFWSIFLLRGQVFLVYFFGGISKLNPDWLAGEPIGMWFRSGAVSAGATLLSPPLRDALQSLLAQDRVIFFFSYGGLVFDLVVGFLLMFRRTRIFAIGLCVLFHSFNYFMIEHVGIVAPMAFWGTLMFLDPDWPRRLYRWLRRPTLARPDPRWLIAGMIVVPGIGALLGWSLPPTRKPSTAKATSTQSPSREAPSREAPSREAASWLVMIGVFGWLVFQAAVPLRHYLISSDSHWTDEGARFSWFLMTRNKVGGFVQFRVEDDVLIRRHSSGEEEIDWSNWIGERPPFHVENVNATQMDWSRIPEIFVTFEPLLGERVFLKVKADDPRGNEEIQQWVETYWKQRYGRTPRIYATTSLKQILEELRARSLRQARERQLSPSFSEAVARAGFQAERLRERALDQDDRRRAYFSLHKTLKSIFRQFGGEVGQQLLRVHPFDIQGGEPDESWRILMLTDGELLDTESGPAWRLRRDAWRGEPFDVADLDMMLAEDMEALPPLFLSREVDGRWTIRWNYTHDLTRSQSNHLSIWPFVAHQYAQRVAAEWQGRFGRRPKVFVSSYLALNQHPLQAIIDPTIDLASRRYFILRHNEWILPLRRASASEKAPPAK